MKYIIKKNDGSVSIMTLIEGINVEDEIAKWSEEDRNSIDSYEKLEGDVPEDRTFRQAWTHDLSVDMCKAKEIWRNKLRIDRMPLLNQLDVEFMRKLEKGEDVSKVTEKKQYLRDITKLPEIEEASTSEELKQITIKEI